MNHPDHDCPGGCGTQVDHSLLACLTCWYLLPLELRRNVQLGGSGRLQAIATALRWYRQHRERNQP